MNPETWTINFIRRHINGVIWTITATAILAICLLTETPRDRFCLKEKYNQLTQGYNLNYADNSELACRTMFR